MAKLEDARAAGLSASLPADLVVSRTLARAVAAYVERRRNFSLPRRREIAAQLAEPLVRKLGLPVDTNHDHLLCALYHRAFMAGASAVVDARQRLPLPAAGRGVGTG